MPIDSGRFQNLARAVSAYSDEAYTLERKLISTALVGSDARISGTDEDYYGTIRWYKPLGSTLQYDGSDDTTGAATVINVATQTSDEGAKTGISTDFAEYVKTVRTHGADQYNVQQVISGQDGLAKIARDFGETQARDQDAALTAVLQGVASAEARTGTGSAAANNGGQEDPNSFTSTNGFFVDLNNTDTQGNFDTSGSNDGQLIDMSISNRGDRLQRILAASSIAWSDYEPDFMYLVVQPSEYLKIRQSNFIDEERAVDGNLQFETMLGGRYRIIVSRKSFGSFAASTFVQSTSTNTSFLCLPGSISMLNLDVPNPVAFDRDESVGRGTGTVEAWYRWGYVMHPRGYTWQGSKSEFVVNVDTNTSRANNAAVNGYFHNPASGTVRQAWGRKEDMLNLGILPIFHS